MTTWFSQRHLVIEGTLIGLLLDFVTLDFSWHFLSYPHTDAVAVCVTITLSVTWLLTTTKQDTTHVNTFLFCVSDTHISGTTETRQSLPKRTTTSSSKETKIWVSLSIPAVMFELEIEHVHFVTSNKERCSFHLETGNWKLVSIASSSSLSVISSTSFRQVLLELPWFAEKREARNQSICHFDVQSRVVHFAMS